MAKVGHNQTNRNQIGRTRDIPGLRSKTGKQFNPSGAQQPRKFGRKKV